MSKKTWNYDRRDNKKIDTVELNTNLRIGELNKRNYETD